MARRRLLGRRGGDGPGWRGGGCSVGEAETGRDGEAEAGRDTGRRRDGEAEAGQTSGRTAESAALLRPLRSPSPPPDPEGRGGCSARVLPWTRVGQGSTCGNRTALSYWAEVRVRAGGCAGARARPRMSAGRLNLNSELYPYKTSTTLYKLLRRGF